jgi:hypothetical protein
LENHHKDVRLHTARLPVNFLCHGVLPLLIVFSFSQNHFLSAAEVIEEQHLPPFHHPLLSPTNNNMVRDTASSHLHIVSCYEDSSEDSSIEIMKRPLITSTTPRSNNVFLKAEEQTRLENEKEHGGKGLVWKVFLLGCVSGSALQVVVFATCHGMFKMWGAGCPMSHWTLVLLSQVSVSVCIAIWLTYSYCTRTKSGSLLHTHTKKFYQDVETPAGSNSISTGRMLVVVGIYFWFGFEMGSSCSIWTVVMLRMGNTAPSLMLSVLMTASVVKSVLFGILIKSFYCGRHNRSGEEEEEEEEEEGEEEDYDSNFVLINESSKRRPSLLHAKMRGLV